MNRRPVRRPLERGRIEVVFDHVAARAGQACTTD
jgi:hypothetical protein